MDYYMYNARFGSFGLSIAARNILNIDMYVPDQYCRRIISKEEYKRLQSIKIDTNTSKVCFYKINAEMKDNIKIDNFRGWETIIPKHINNRLMMNSFMAPPNNSGRLHAGHVLGKTIISARLRHACLKGYNIDCVVGIDHGGHSTNKKIMNETQRQKGEITRAGFDELYQSCIDQGKALLTQDMKDLGINTNMIHYTLDEKFRVYTTKVFCYFYNAGLIKPSSIFALVNPNTGLIVPNTDQKHKLIKAKSFIFEYECISNGVSIGLLKFRTCEPELVQYDVALAIHGSHSDLMTTTSDTIIQTTTMTVLTNTFAINPVTKKPLKILYSKSKSKSVVFRINPLDAGFDLAVMYDLEIPQDFDMSWDECLNRRTEFNQSADEIEMSVVTDYNDVILNKTIRSCFVFDCNPMIQLIQEDIPTIIGSTYHKTMFLNGLKTYPRWCLTRDGWSGHKVPLYTTKDAVFAAESYEQAKQIANNQPFVQFEGLLDTWFTSALYPSIIMCSDDPESWNRPGIDSLLDQCRYKTFSFMVAGEDIINPWIIPICGFSLMLFKRHLVETIVIHGLLHREDGQKLSKNNGDVIPDEDKICDYDMLKCTLLKTIDVSPKYIFNEDHKQKTINIIKKIKGINSIALPDVEYYGFESTITECEVEFNAAIENFCFSSAYSILHKCVYKHTNYHIINHKFINRSLYKRILSMASIFLPHTAANI